MALTVLYVPYSLGSGLLNPYRTGRGQRHTEQDEGSGTLKSTAGAILPASAMKAKARNCIIALIVLYVVLTVLYVVLTVL